LVGDVGVRLGGSNGEWSFADLGIDFEAASLVAVTIPCDEDD
jgi:hypothetical protein